MLPTFVGLFLIALLLFAHFTFNKSNIEKKLDIDEELPFPAAGQGSSIFSLTALFGAYLAILFIVGLTAIIGIALGSAVGLLLIRSYLFQYKDKTFQYFLYKRFDLKSKVNVVFIFFILISQILFASSELLLLKGVLSLGFELSPSYASVVSVFLGLIVYFYCLGGGYITIFKTDIVQFISITLMCLVILWFLIFTSSNKINFHSLQLGSEMWSLGVKVSILKYSIQVVLGFIMGISFILASPDTWKRIFVSIKQNRAKQFWSLVIAGLLPFVILLPLKFYSLSDDIFSLAYMKFLIVTLENQNQIFLSIILVGIISSFMSSFDSSLINSVHFMSFIKLNKPKMTIDQERVVFVKYMGTNFIIINLVFIIIPGLTINNSYFLANLLVGAYAFISGYLIGTKGCMRKVSINILMLMILLSMVFWFIYIVNIPNVLEFPQKLQIGTIPMGVLLCLVVMIISYIFSNNNHLEANNE